MYFWGWVCCAVCGRIPREGGRDRGWTGLAPSSQTVGSLLRTPWMAKLSGKKTNFLTNFYIFANVFFGKFDLKLKLFTKFVAKSLLYIK